MQFLPMTDNVQTLVSSESLYSTSITSIKLAVVFFYNHILDRTRLILHYVVLVQAAL